MQLQVTEPLTKVAVLLLQPDQGEMATIKLWFSEQLYTITLIWNDSSFFFTKAFFSCGPSAPTTTTTAAATTVHTHTLVLDVP